MYVFPKQDRTQCQCQWFLSGAEGPIDIKKEGVIGFEWSKSQKPFFTHELRFKLFVAN